MFKNLAFFCTTSNALQVLEFVFACQATRISSELVQALIVYRIGTIPLSYHDEKI